ncbi:MAG: beta-ketoacyl-[acyl-carrier-protein] synthase family protein [Deltaproteobacteria bacterium]|nr:beta-ketoacyl-[acyl-carrier-protein] synthase family protein [Deltaproteobacteria bacterium]
MKYKNRRVAITGIGIISCLGLNRDEVQISLREGRSGVHFLHERKALGFQSALSGIVEGFDPKSVLDRKQRKTLPEYGLWAWSAVSQALEQAGIHLDSLTGDEKTGVVFGNDSSAVTAVEQVDTLRSAGETRAIGSGHIFRLLASTVTLNLNTILGIRGVSFTVSGACASGVMAVGQGAEIIAFGRQDRIICGGVQEISWESMCSFDALGAFSRRENNPGAASRPFDRDRDGLVPSGGAAAIVLEAFELAKARGAQILGEVIGYSNTSDGHHIAVPSGEGLKRAMHYALMNAALSPDDIDLVLSHATSTQAGDRAEAIALRNIFDLDGAKKGPIVSAVKGLTGHEFWMAGASQLVYGLLMAWGGFVAGNPNLEVPDPAAEVLYLPKQTVTFRPRFMLCNASGFGGTNACLVIRIPR